MSSSIEHDAAFAPPRSHVADLVPPSSAFDGPVLASRWARLGATGIDTALGMAMFLGASLAGLHALIGDFAGRGPWYGSLVWLLLLSLPHLYLLIKSGQTIGKRVIGVRVVRTDGSTVSAWRILGLRWVLPSLLSMLPVVGQVVLLIDALPIFSANRRCLHDHLADTIVIKA